MNDANTSTDLDTSSGTDHDDTSTNSTDTDGPLPDRCGAKRRSTDGYCRLYPATDDEGNEINGRCRFHGGAENIGGQEKNANAWTHGATASRKQLAGKLSDEDLAWVEDLADRYRRLGGYEEDDPRSDLIYDVCLASWQRSMARSTAIANDLKHNSVVGTNEEGRVVKREEEHYLGPAASRLSREIRQNLKELGIIGSGDTETISTRSAAQIIAEAIEASDTDSDTSPQRGDHPAADVNAPVEEDAPASEDVPISEEDTPGESGTPTGRDAPIGDGNPVGDDAPDAEEGRRR